MRLLYCKRNEEVLKSDLDKLKISSNSVEYCINDILIKSYISKPITFYDGKIIKSEYIWNIYGIDSIQYKLNEYPGTKVSVIPNRFFVKANDGLLENALEITLSRSKTLINKERSYKLTSVTTVLGEVYLMIITNQDIGWDSGEWFKCYEGKVEVVSDEEVNEAACKPGSILGYFIDVK